MAEEVCRGCDDPGCRSFPCKAKYWRQHGMQTHIPAEWGTGPTQREIGREIVDKAKESGRDIALAHDKYRWL